jgi:predicted nucleotidyltransferase component of viral defense system
MIPRIEANWAAHDSGADLHLIQQEMVLVYALESLGRAGVLPRLAFKGGTYLRLMVTGDSGRLSEDLDFTNVGLAPDPTGVLEAAFAQGGVGVEFRVKDPYRTAPGNWACAVEYAHDWDKGRFLLEIRYRDAPFLPTVPTTPLPRRWFRLLPFAPPAVPCLRLEEAMAEKVRAVQQRATERDLYDLMLYARKGFDPALVRLLATAKLWSDHEPFRPSEVLAALAKGRKAWTELDRLVGRTRRRDWNRELADTAGRYGFLSALTPFEVDLAEDARRHRREGDLRRRLDEVPPPRAGG